MNGGAIGYFYHLEPTLNTKQAIPISQGNMFIKRGRGVGGAATYR